MKPIHLRDAAMFLLKFFPANTILLFFTLFVLFVAGVICLVLGFKERRYNDHPIYGNCGYNRSGMQEDMLAVIEFRLN